MKKKKETIPDKGKHRTIKYKFIPWLTCAKCGLIYLRNEITQKAIKERCDDGY